MATSKKEDTIAAPVSADKFTKTIVDAISAGAVKVEVFAVGKKLRIRIVWE